MRRFSLQVRLVVGVIALAAVGLVAADVATYTSLRSYLIGRVDSTLDAVHQDVAHAVFGGGPGGPAPSGYCVEVRSAAQRIVGVSGCQTAPGQPQQPPPSYPRIVMLPPATGAPVDRVRYFTVPAVSGSGEYRVRASIEVDQPQYILLIAAPLGGEESTLHQLLLVELLVTAAVLAALAALALWIVQIGLRPLGEIERTAATITGGDLSRRVADPNPRTEVGRVGTALNAMLDRIEASDRRLRRFVGDASHELRTPLASVRAYAELFARGAAARPADLERAMNGIVREAERMSVLVDDLLLLARLDEGRPLEREPVDFEAVVSQAVDAARAVEPERPIEAVLEPAIITGDGGRLRQVVDNLFANVRAHTPAGTPVSVELRTANGEAKLSVADHGPGLAEDDAARIFERFYRVDTSRARASGGVGLGLSIVSAVVAAHGGSVAAEPTPGGGATFVIVLPLAG